MVPHRRLRPITILAGALGLAVVYWVLNLQSPSNNANANARSGLKVGKSQDPEGTTVGDLLPPPANGKFGRAGDASSALLKRLPCRINADVLKNIENKKESAKKG